MLNLIDKISDKYFDEIINRRGENSLKWARGANELPLLGALIWTFASHQK